MIIQNSSSPEKSCPHFHDLGFCKQIKKCNNTCGLLHTISESTYIKSKCHFCLNWALNGKCFANDCQKDHLSFEKASKMISEAFKIKRKHCHKCAESRKQCTQQTPQTVSFDRADGARERQKERKRKTCSFFQRGECQFGSNCRNLHESPDLRETKLSKLDMKTKMPDLRRKLSTRASQESNSTESTSEYCLNMIEEM